MRIDDVPTARILETLPRCHVSTLYGRDAAVVELEARDPLDPESSAYIVALIVDQGELQAWCKQVPTGRACPYSGNTGKTCKHQIASLLAWEEALK